MLDDGTDQLGHTRAASNSPYRVLSSRHNCS